MRLSSKLMLFKNVYVAKVHSIVQKSLCHRRILLH